MLPENITQAREAATTASTTAGNMAAGQGTIEDVLKRKVLEAYNYNKDIVGPLDTATAGYTSAPATARDKFSDIFNPGQKESLVSQYTANQSIPMLSLANVLGQRSGRIEDTIGAGSRAYAADTAAKQAQADSAWRNYQALLGEYQLANPPKQYQIGNVGKTGYVFDPSTGEIIKTFEGADSGSGGSDMASILSMLFPNGINGSGGGNVQQPTEPKPTQPPVNWQSRTNINWRSPEGQWAWDNQSADWVPIID